MTHSPPVIRIALIGYGAIGQKVLAKLKGSIFDQAEYAVFDRSSAGAQALREQGAESFSEAAQLLAWHPQLCIECAGHAAVAQVVPGLLTQGCDVILASVGALSNDALRAALDEAQLAGRGRLILVAGAIGGLDALAAARSAGLNRVRYIGRKPPTAWLGTPAENSVDLHQLAQPRVIFTGTARAATQLFPKNANVTAAVALAGLGFEATEVELIADPTVKANVHELSVQGSFGAFDIRLQNNPMPENPKTSWLAALSIESEIRQYLQSHLAKDPQWGALAFTLGRGAAATTTTLTRGAPA